ncbi:two-component system response regulator [Aliifodinibius salipaludis]|uniref:Two-component system response regulator n=1 Tax=Fodinibius salipaludis TaxID=2032627 RepID=A0A2A2GBP9_9BACT|nr:response regulator [Aliifodinibius salipaludis]PAU94630.1 two-component system response regulator [Aliifodinibius salipaludis]
MKINVLIVEDDAAMRVVLKNTVQSVEMDIEIENIYEAENGKEGIKALKDNESIDLMLVDIYMPVMDGLDMLDYVHDHPDFQHIPAIVVSTENDEERIDAILRQGLGFVPKPLTHVLLKDQIVSMIGENADEK